MKSILFVLFLGLSFSAKADDCDDLRAYHDGLIRQIVKLSYEIYNTPMFIEILEWKRDQRNELRSQADQIEAFLDVCEKEKGF